MWNLRSGTLVRLDPPMRCTSLSCHRCGAPLRPLALPMYDLPGPSNDGSTPITVVANMSKSPKGTTVAHAQKKMDHTP